MKKKLSIGIIILTILNGILLFNVIGITVLMGKFIKLYSDFELDITSFVYTVLHHGYLVSIIMLIGVIFFVRKEWLKHKTISLKTSIIVFTVLAIWLKILMHAVYTPIIMLIDSIRNLM